MTNPRRLACKTCGRPLSRRGATARYKFYCNPCGGARYRGTVSRTAREQSIIRLAKEAIERALVDFRREYGWEVRE